MLREAHRVLDDNTEVLSMQNSRLWLSEQMKKTTWMLQKFLLWSLMLKESVKSKRKKIHLKTILFGREKQRLSTWKTSAWSRFESPLTSSETTLAVQLNVTTGSAILESIS